jgi:hypothetical protein
MEDLSEAILMHNWLQESDALASEDYGFLINLYLEVNHIISECPNTPDGRHVAHLLQKQSNRISNQLELLEDQIDIYMSEYFEATGSEASGWEVSGEDAGTKDMQKTITHLRRIKYDYSWKIEEITGPTGEEVPDDLELSGLEESNIDNFVREWAENKISEWDDNESELFSYWSDSDDSDSTYENESITYTFDSEINGKTFTFTITIDATVEMDYEPNGSEDDGFWENA